MPRIVYLDEDMDLIRGISGALDWCKAEGVEIPLDIQLKARQFGAMKADGDLSKVNKAYNKRIVESLTAYFEGGSITTTRNAFRRGVIDAFGDAFDLGWQEGGGEFPVDEDAVSWLEARINQEFGYIDMLFQEAKELRKEADFDYFSWTTERSDGYLQTLREVYNSGRLRAMDGNTMVTFDGEDGAETCPDCKRLKGKRHKISWFVACNVVPPHGVGLECHPGRRCQHGLKDDKGKWVTA